MEKFQDHKLPSLNATTSEEESQECSGSRKKIAKQDGKKDPETKKSSKSKFGCKHDYAYCYYNSKECENVYQCVKCGKWVYQ